MSAWGGMQASRRRQAAAAAAALAGATAAVAAAAALCNSRRRKSWFRVRGCAYGEEDGVLSWTHTPAHGAVYYAYFAPYP